MACLQITKNYCRLRLFSQFSPNLSSQQVITCSKLTTETREQDAKYIQS